MDFRVANGNSLRTSKNVSIPVKVDLTDKFTQTAFAVAENKDCDVPFLLAMPQILALGGIIDSTPGRECLYSRKYGFAYKLRKPQGHLLWDMMNSPMIKLDHIPQMLNINWDTFEKRTDHGNNQKQVGFD